MTSYGSIMILNSMRLTLKGSASRWILIKLPQLFLGTEYNTAPSICGAQYVATYSPVGLPTFAPHSPVSTSKR